MRRTKCLKGRKKKSKVQAEGEAMDVDKIARGQDEPQTEEKKKKGKREDWGATMKRWTLSHSVMMSNKTRLQRRETKNRETFEDVEPKGCLDSSYVKFKEVGGVDH